MSDRTVFAETAEKQVVRYDRAGKWWIEYRGRLLLPGRQVSLREAVRTALEMANSGGVIFDRNPGGKAFYAAFARKHLDDARRDWMDRADALARALAWYANPKNWHEDDWGVRSVVVPPDYGNAGQRARRALKRQGYERLIKPQKRDSEARNG